MVLAGVAPEATVLVPKDMLGGERWMKVRYDGCVGCVGCVSLGLLMRSATIWSLNLNHDIRVLLNHVDVPG